MCITSADCVTLDTTWNFVLTEPALPVHHGTTLALSCAVDHVIKGGNKATCQDGQVVSTATPPQCSLVGKILV